MICGIEMMRRDDQQGKWADQRDGRGRGRVAHVANQSPHQQPPVHHQLSATGSPETKDKTPATMRQKLQMHPVTMYSKPLGLFKFWNVSINRCDPDQPVHQESAALQSTDEYRL